MNTTLSIPTLSARPAHPTNPTSIVLSPSQIQCPIFWTILLWLLQNPSLFSHLPCFSSGLSQRQLSPQLTVAFYLFWHLFSPGCFCLPSTTKGRAVIRKARQINPLLCSQWKPHSLTLCVIGLFLWAHLASLPLTDPLDCTKCSFAAAAATSALRPPSLHPSIFFTHNSFLYSWKPTTFFFFP